MAEPTPESPAATAQRPPLLKLYETNRPAVALLALLVLEIVPVLGLAASAREGWDAWATPAAVLGAAALVGPVGLFLGRGWGVIAASYVAWAGLVLVVLRAMTVGFTPLGLAPGLAYAAALSGLSSLARKEAPAASGAPPDLPLGAWVKENVEAIVVAFIMALVIRCFGIEVFKIPSSSMEPTLLGDVTQSHRPGSTCHFPNVHVTNGGDRIMVTKFFYAAAEIQRYDVVVFKFPLNQSRNFIKRVVGLPDEELKLFHGNVFVRKPGETAFQIARRPQRTQDSLWIDPAGVRGFFDKWDTFDEFWEKVDGPTPALAAGELRFDTPLPPSGASFRLKNDPHDPDGQTVSDLRIVFEATLTSPSGEVFAEIVNAYGRFELRMSAAEDGKLRWFNTHAREAQPRKDTPVGRRLELDRRVRMELGVYDGQAYARVDGAFAKIDFISTREGMKADGIDPLLPGDSAIRFGGRNGAFQIRNLKVGRDVHYKAGRSTSRFDEDKPWRIRPGHYVMMGDNVTSSHDSRGWMQQGYSLVGRDDVVVYEGQQDDPEAEPAAVQNRYGLRVAPSKAVADKYGRIWALYTQGTDPKGLDLPAGIPAGVIDRSLDPVDFYEIGQEFIIGKALWVWWPPGRWFKLIR
jgi:signal peptidase I